MTGGRRCQQKSFRGRAPRTTMKKPMSRKFKDTDHNDLLQEEKQRALSTSRRLPRGSHVKGSSSTGSMPGGVTKPSAAAPRAPATKKSASASNSSAPDEDDGADAVQELRAELDREAQSFVERVATECNVKVAEALAISSEGSEGRRADAEAANELQRSMENDHASIAADCAEMLKSLEYHSGNLLGLEKRYSAALTSLGQAENRKLKNTIARRLSSMG